jgi:hypothetical protein
VSRANGRADVRKRYIRSDYIRNKKQTTKGNNMESKKHWWLVSMTGHHKKGTANGYLIISTDFRLFDKNCIEKAIETKQREDDYGDTVINSVSYLGKGTEKAFNAKANEGA